MMSKAERLPTYVTYIIIALVLAIVVYVRIRLLAVPLERDEGEFAYMGQLLLKGIPPFSHAYTLKLPGVSIVYAFFMFLFGQTPAGIHAGLLIVNGICVCLVYMLAKQLFDCDTALFSCASYAVLSLSNAVSGIFAHATHFVALFALTGFLLLLYFKENRWISLLLICGICFGLAFTMKQHAVLLLFFAVLYFVWSVWRNPPSDKIKYLVGSFIFLLGMIIPYLLIVLWMVKAGSFDNFWFWTVQYAREYASTPPLVNGLSSFTNSFGAIVKSEFPFCILAGLGCFLLSMKKIYCSDRLFMFGFLIFSFLATCPGLIFRGHYFILLLPVVAILAGAGINYAGSLLSSVTSARLTPLIPLLLFVVAITYSFHHGKDSFFRLTPLEVSRTTYGANPFPEALQIADYIKDNTASTDKIAVLGSEPEIYFYADRLSATGHIYMYGLMENQPYALSMQTEMIREIESVSPKYIVVVNVAASWMVQKKSIRYILDWGERYIANLYDLVGMIDIIDPVTTRYIWGVKAVGYTPATETFVTVFKRKSGER